MGFIVKALGNGIGLASEAIHHSKEKKREASATAEAGPCTPAALPAVVSRSGSYRSGDGSGLSVSRQIHSASHDESSSSTTDYEKQYDDEAIWELDDMGERLDPPAYTEIDEMAHQHQVYQFQAATTSDSGAATRVPLSSDSEEVKKKKEKNLIRELVQMAGPPPQPPQRLPCPVILPQRRPGKKDRGFVRAYAPVLAEIGISQDVFLSFLKDWDASSKASPWIEVVFVAAQIVGFVPEPAAQITSIVVSVAAGAAREVQSRQRKSSYLDRANRELFMPRGLFALVMSFTDTEQVVSGSPLRSLFASRQLDVRGNTSEQAATAAAAAMRRGSENMPWQERMRSSSGRTVTELELPPAAELVYPAVDRAAEHDLAAVADNSQQGAGISQKWRSAGHFVGDYLDRRAQATYEAQHPGSALAVPAEARKAFSSRFSDPNHPANSGSLVALLTGGAVVPEQRQRQDRQDRRERREDRMERRERRSGRYDYDRREDDYGRGSTDRSGLGGLGGLRGLGGYGRPRGLVGGLISAATTAASNSRAGTSTASYGAQNAPSIRGVGQLIDRGGGLLNKSAQKNVLYLLVVNLPTDEEAAMSAAQLDRAVGAPLARQAYR